MAKSKNYPIAAVDMVVFTVEDNALKVILIKMKKKPFKNRWAFPGGRVGVKESLDQAAQRELYEKTGLKKVYLEQLYTFGQVNRDPLARIVSVAYFALVNSQGIRLKTTTKYAGIDWFNVKELPSLAYDHKEIAKVALERLRAKLEYTNIVYSLLPRYFTLSELRRVYEIILDRKLDRRNFQKKIFRLKLLRPTSQIRKGLPHRPARLYAFRKREPMIIEIL